MSDRIKKIKVKKVDGSMTDYIPIGVNAENVDFDNGFNLDNIIGSINPNESGNIATQLSKSIKYYDCVADMKADTTLNSRGTARTLGYYEPGDGGGALYQIIDATAADFNTLTDDGGSVHDLENNLKAKLIIEDSINVHWFGAKGDGITDDWQAIQNCFLYIKNNLTDIENKFLIYFNPSKTYYINKTLAIFSNTDFNLNGSTLLCNKTHALHNFRSEA